MPLLLLPTALLAVAGTWLANAMIALGVVLLLMRVYFQRQCAQIRHVETGEPIPALDFFEQMGRFIAVSFRLRRNFNPLENVLEGGRRYGPTRVFWAGWKPLVIVSEPDDIRKLLQDKEELFYKKRALGANPTLPRVMGSSLLTVAGDKWKVQRKAMDPAFQYKKMRTLVPMFSRCARKLILKWLNQIRSSDDPVVRVEEGLTEMTLDAIGLGAFGYDFGAVDGIKETSENLERYHKIIEAVFRPLAFIFPFLTKVPTAYNMRLEVAISGFQDFLAHVIATHRERKSDEKTEHELDLLDHIIALDEDGQLTNEEISHNLFLFFLAGHDTTSSSLTAALYFFAKHPHMQQKAYDEVLTVLGASDGDGSDDDRPLHELTLGELSKLEYLSMFIKETLRMRPPVGGTTGRAVVKEEGVVLGGYLVPQGVSVSPSIWCYHYDERYWPEPYTFKPERFAAKPAADQPVDKNSASGSSAQQQQQTHDILTFSMGPRICIGKKFAMTEMLTTLALLLQTFEFELETPDYEWRFRPIGITLRPFDGLPLRLKPRSSRPTA